MNSKTEDRRLDHKRRALVAALSSGAFVGGLGWAHPAQAAWWSRKASPQAGRSVYDLQGQATLDGRPISRDTAIPATGKVAVAPGGQLIFAVGDSAFVLRERSVLELQGKDLLLRSLRLLSGGLMSVFGKRSADQSIRLQTSTATIGIRGTGVYVESEADRSYVCNCYGSIDLSVSDLPEVQERIVSRYHDAPRWVYRPGAKEGRLILPAPFQNHEDIELMTIESMMGRKVPFFVPDSGYSGPRRRY